MTIKEFAQLAGVSVSTVSKILNHKDANISPQTREHVLSLAKIHNYKPYSFVRTQYPEQTSIFGVIFRDCIPDDRLLKGLMNVARSYGYGITVLESHLNKTQELKNLSLLASSNVDGILFNPINSKPSSEVNAQLKQSKKPYFLFSTEEDIPGPDFLPTISYKSMAEFLTQNLVQAGHSKIALVAEKESPIRNEFIEGFKSCLYQNAIPFTEEFIFCKDNEKFYRHISCGSISAVLTLHFQSSFQIYQRLLSRHLHIPNDFSLLTLCKHQSNIHNFSEISALLIPFEEFGEYLGSCLIKHLEHSENTEQERKYFQPDYHLNHTKSISAPAMTKRKKVLVLGSVNIDSYLFFRELPSPGMAAKTSRSSNYLGGKGMNQAIGVSKLGHHASIIGLVGDDLEADTIYESAKQAGINTAYLKRVHGELTGKGYIFLNNSGDSIVSILSGANECVNKKNVEEALPIFKDSHLCLLNTEVPQDTILTACRLAKSYKLPVLLKPSSIRQIDSEILALTDIFLPNLEEAQILLSTEESQLSKKLQRMHAKEACDKSLLEQCADYFLKKGTNMVIITLGKQGLFAKGKGILGLYTAKEVKAIDTTGAADAFISALASYLLLDYPMEQAIRIASYAAALSVTREGAAPSLVDKNSLEAYIATEEPEILE